MIYGLIFAYIPRWREYIRWSILRDQQRFLFLVLQKRPRLSIYLFLLFSILI